MAQPLRQDGQGTAEGELEIVWAPFRPQRYFLACPHWEVLQEGERGGGKSEAALVSFARHIGCGWGDDWRGLYLRRTYRELKDIMKKSEHFFGPRGKVAAWRSARFNRSPGGAQGYTWEFETGEWLMFAAAKRSEDIAEFLGWELPWINFGELTTWPTPEIYDALKGTSRSSHPEVARNKKYCSETNPWGPGSAWVKDYFVAPAPPLVPIPTLQYQDTDGSMRWLYRCRIPSLLSDNPHLANDPSYRAQLLAITDEQKRRAWIGGDQRWEIMVGGIVGDVWSEARHVVLPFNVPHSWRVDRSYDHGTSSPFDVGWWAESDGTGPVELASADGQVWYKGTIPRGSLVLVNEWYGWNGQANTGLRMRPIEIAEGIKERERDMRRGYLKAFESISPGPADTEIFSKLPGEQSTAERMSNAGVRWLHANKAAGTRVQGAEMIRDMLAATVEMDFESPWLLVFDVPGVREGFVRTVPALPRSEKNPDDAESDGVEDHPWDQTRYRVLPKRGRIQMGGRVV